MEENMNNLKKASVRHGAVSVIFTALMIAICVLVNVFMTEIPVSSRQIDVTENRLYTIGDTTKKVLAAVKEDLNIYLIAKKGQEDQNYIRLIKAYTDSNSHIKYILKDPDMDPLFLTNHKLSTVTDNSILVENVQDLNRYKFISYDEMEIVNYISYYDYTHSFDGEGQITSAINYVTANDLPKIYSLTGHGEGELSSTVSTTLEKSNIDVTSLNLLTSEKVPDDCSLLLINAPVVDFSEIEVKRVISYISAGGKSIIICPMLSDAVEEVDESGRKTGALVMGTEVMNPNFRSLLSYYGMSIKDGMLCEGSSFLYTREAPYACVIPCSTGEAVLGNLTSSNYNLMVYAQAIEKTADARNTIEMTPVLTSSGQSYYRSYVGDAQTIYQITKTDADEAGPFTIAMHVVDATDVGRGEIVVFACQQMLSDQILNQFASLANVDVFINAVGAMTSYKSSINIAAKSVSVEVNPYTASEVTLFFSLGIVVIPVAILVVGLVIWLRRRSR